MFRSSKTKCKSKKGNTTNTLFSTFRTKRKSSVAANSEQASDNIILSIGGRPVELLKIHSKEGSTCNLWKVLDKASKSNHTSHYALKVISLSGNEDFFEIEQRTQNELNALQSIRDENVITLLDYEWSCDDPFLVKNGDSDEDTESTDRRYHRYCYLLMPFYPMNLKQYVEQEKSTYFASSQNHNHRTLLNNIMGDICKGVHAIHKAGFRHNDIRPENILIQPYKLQPRVAICDFSSVTPAHVEVASKWEAERQKRFFQRHSKSNFMAPELCVVLPRSWITPKADSFSIGCVLYFLLMTKYPFQEQSTVGRRLLFPKKHELDSFFYHLCFALLLKSATKRVGMEEALKSIFVSQLDDATQNLVHDEFHMFYGVKRGSSSNKKISSPIKKWNMSSTTLSPPSTSCSIQDLEVVRETTFANFLGNDEDDFSDDETVVSTEDDDILNNKSLIRCRRVCSLSY